MSNCKEIILKPKTSSQTKKIRVEYNVKFLTDVAEQAQKQASEYYGKLIESEKLVKILKQQYDDTMLALTYANEQLEENKRLFEQLKKEFDE